MWSALPKKNSDLKLDVVLKEPWSAITVSTFVLPGCTGPRTTMECTMIRQKDGSFSLHHTKKGAGGKKVEGKRVEITAKQLSEIISLIRKYYPVAAAERSFSEELDLLSLKAREAKMKEYEKKSGGRPIGGFARSFISVSVIAGDKKYSFGEEFTSFNGCDKLADALNSYEPPE